MDRICARAAALDCEVMMVAPGTNPAGTVKEAARNFATGGEGAQRVEVVRCHAMPQRTAYAPASDPAIRPNTAPDTRPVPLG